MTTLTVSPSQHSCINVTTLNDDVVEKCEAFFVGFEVDPTFSGVAAIPKDKDKSIIVIVDDVMDSKSYIYVASMCMHGSIKKWQMYLHACMNTISYTICHMGHRNGMHAESATINLTDNTCRSGAWF